MIKEEAIRKKVKALRRFYMDVINFVVVNFILVLIWLTFDKTGVFWPKYVIVVWGLILAIKAFRMGVVPLIFHRSSFLSQEWEERKVRELMRRRPPHHKVHMDKDKKE